MSRGESERGAQPFLPRRAAAAPELRCSCRRAWPRHGPHVSRPCCVPLPAFPSPPGSKGRMEEGREGRRAGRFAAPRVTGRPGWARPREGHGPGGRSGGKVARAQSRPDAALLNCPGHRSKGRSPLRRHRLFSLRAEPVNERGGAGTAVIAGLPDCT